MIFIFIHYEVGFLSYNSNQHNKSIAKNWNAESGIRNQVYIIKPDV